MNVAPLGFTVLRPTARDAQMRKVLHPDGTIIGAAAARHFEHGQVAFADIRGLAALVAQLQRENVMVIRGAPASDRQPLPRHLAGRRGRGENGFVPTPRRWIALDVDGAALPAFTSWRENVEEAVDAIVGMLPEPWSSTSYAWALTGTHGLETEEGSDGKRWTGRFTEDRMRCRLWFVLDNEIDDGQAEAWVGLLKRDALPALDPSICRTIQPNYTARPVCADGTDPLGDFPTAGFVEREFDELAVPPDLPSKVARARAEGIGGSTCAPSASAEEAVRGIGKPVARGFTDGSRGEVRGWLFAAARHLARTNKRPEGVSVEAHADGMAETIRQLIDTHRGEIAANLTAHGRQWSDVNDYLDSGNVAGICEWWIEAVEEEANEPSGDGAGRRKRVAFSDQPAPAAGVEIVSVEKARRIAREKTQAFRQAALQWWQDAQEREAEAGEDDEAEGAPPVVHTLGVATGVGKSVAIRQAAAEMVLDLQAAGAPSTVVIAVPRHDLADEQAAAFDALPIARKHGLRAEVWRGREADNPNAPGEKMCVRHKEARAVQSAGLRPGETLCKRKVGDQIIVCPFGPGCAYVGQEEKRAAVWIVPHQLVFTSKPAALGKVGAVFVDEQPGNAALEGFDPEPTEIPLELIRADFQIPADNDEDDDAAERARKSYSAIEATRTLRSLRLRLYDLLTGADGPIASQAVRQAFTVEELHEAHRLEWRRKTDPGIRPDMSPKEIASRLALAKANAGIGRFARVWRVLDELRQPFIAPALSGRLEVVTAKDDRRVIRMRGVSQPTAGFLVPTLIADATLDAELLRPIWPTIQASPRYAVTAPHVTVHQVVDRAFAKATLAVGETTNEAERARRAHNVRKMWARLLRHAGRYGDAPVLVVLQLPVEKEVRATLYVPPNVHLIHHGAVAGLDGFKDARAIYVVGRQYPRASVVGRVAGALTGSAVADAEFAPVLAAVPLVGGGSVQLETLRHPDPIAERYRWQITESGLLQAIGRGRGVNRTAADPLDIHLWTDVPLPELGPVHAAVWDEIPGDLDDEMIAVGGVAFENSGDAARCFPSLFASENAAKCARKRERQMGSNPFNNISKGERPHLAVVHYRRDSARVGAAVAYAHPGRLPDLRDWMTKRLGRLASLSIISTNTPPAADATGERQTA